MDSQHPTMTSPILIYFRFQGNVTGGVENDPQLPKYRRDLVQKLKVLRSDLMTQQPQTGHCRMEVSRTEVFEDSYR